MCGGQVNEVKDAVDYYVGSNQEPDFVEDDAWDQPLEADRDVEEVIAENQASHKSEGGTFAVHPQTDVSHT
jgi:CCR4-NOT transcriptional regulation complex NOT5 subunit